MRERSKRGERREERGKREGATEREERVREERIR